MIMSAFSHYVVVAILLLSCGAPRSCLSFVNNIDNHLHRGRRFPPSPPSHAATVPGEETTAGRGGWEWDGVVEEGAHDAEFGVVAGNDDDDIFVPSIGFLSAANSVPSSLVSSLFDPSRNAGTIHRRQLSAMEGEGGGDDDDDYVVSEDDLMEMGGDPAFLDDFEYDDDAKKARRADDAADDDFYWDGTVDEDAHND